MGAMKTTFPQFMLLTCLLFAGLNGVSLASGMARKPLPAKPLPAMTRDSIYIHKQVISKSHKILLYPDASQKVIFFSVKGEEGRVYQLFIFDLEGKLVKQTEIRNRQTTVIREMDKGEYMFDVFSDDLKIGSGQMNVR